MKGSYSIGIQHDVGAMKIDLLDEEGVVQLTHFIMPDTTATGVVSCFIAFFCFFKKEKGDWSRMAISFCSFYIFEEDKKGNHHI